jgi:hypothetical protein
MLQGTVADLARKTINAEVPGLPWLSGHHLTLNATRRTKDRSVAVIPQSRPPKAFDDRSYLYLYFRVGWSLDCMLILKLFATFLHSFALCQRLCS